jgi:hypothetical protein
VRNGFAVFFITLILLAILRIGIPMVSVPDAMILPASLLVTAIFVTLPIIAVFKVAAEPWSAKLAGAFVGAGLLIHFGLGMMVRMNLLGEGLLPAIAHAISQSGFFLWCVGLGALISFLLKDRNLLIPVSIFLVAFDIFLVFTPMGITQQVLKQATGGPAKAFGYVGPADFLFMGMFFVALHRFNLRAKETAMWLVPAVLVYLLLSFVLPAIPLLVPIGLTVLLVNLSAFKMDKSEKQATIGLAVICAIALAAIFLMTKKPAGPLKPGDVRVVPESEGSLGPSEAVPAPSQTPTAPGSTPSPP